MEIAITVVLLVFAVACGIVAAFQFLQKGFLFNNAYLYVGDEQRKTMDKKPYYRQSGIVFCGISLYFLLDALYFLLKKQVLFYVALGAIALTVLYAVFSAFRINRLSKKP